MAKGVPSRAELQKAIIVNTFTTIVGVIIGLAINQWWHNHNQKGAQVPMPGMSV